MNHKSMLLLLSLLAILVSLVLGTPDRHCMDCICQASSGCKSNLGCHNSGSNQYFCGPYQISWAYWADGGKPAYNGFSDGDYASCASSRSCAERVIQNYMKKYERDCNGDGRIDCLDYAAIHKAGATGCNQQWLLNSKYWNQFRQCYQYQSLSLSPFTPARPILSTPNGRHRPSSTIIEIPKPILPSRTVAAVSSRASVSPFATSDDSVFSASYSSSSSRVNYSRSEIEISENLPFTGTRGAPSIVSIPNRPSSPPLIVPSTNFKPVPSRVVISNSNSGSGYPTRENVVVTSHAVSSKPDLTISADVVSTNCLQCLCQASTQCNLNKGCDGAYCGPYLLSWGYWADGGQPNGDYVSCSKDKTCSEQVIRNYLKKWQRDCNEDGTTDCIDFALIHKLGPHGCGKIQALELTDYWGNFTACHGTRRNEIRSYPLEPSSPNSITDNVLVSDRLIGPVKPVEPIEINSAPAPVLVEEEPRPLSARRQSVPLSSTGNYNRTQPENTSVRITFNNRDIVNTFPSYSRQPPQPSLTEIPQPPNNLNNIITSPLRPPTRPQPEEVLKPILIEERPRRPSRVEVPVSSSVASSSNTNPARVDLIPEDYFSEPLPAEPNAQDLPGPTVNEPESVAVRVEPPTSRSLLGNSGVTNNLTTASRSNQLVSQECLECICHASSRCSSSIGCLNDGTGKFICGPFQVDWEYWTEAGKPGNRADLSNLENFQMCSNNRQCADETVRNFMQKWHKDCNEDGSIDCNDFAAIHVAGPRNCNAQWYLDSKYYSDFRECFDFRRR